MLKSSAMVTGVWMAMAMACAGDDSGRDLGDPAGSSQDDDRGAGASLGTFEFTYYWVASEASYTGAKDTSVYNSQCTKLATVPKKFWDALKLEGTGRLTDGRLLNYSGPCGCARSPCFKELGADKPWGEGVQSRALSPYRSIAVDKNKIAYGSWMYIPELDGVMMPGDAPWGGWLHDGCVQAADTGSAIVGKHIDFFVGLKSSYTSLINTEGLASVTVRHGGTLCTGEPPEDDDDAPQDEPQDEPDVTTQVCFPGADNQNTTCLPLAFPVNPTGYKYPAPLNANYRSPIAYLDLDAVDVNTKVAPNFKLGEFVSRAKGRYAVLQPHAVARMQTLRGQLGSISLNSGYRSPTYNASVGGANSSRHMFGDGFDFVGNNVTLTKAENACTNNGGFLVEYSSHVHCDWRGTNVDPLFYGAVAVATDPELPLAAFSATLSQENGTWYADAGGFDEGEPMRRWTALDAAGEVLVETTGESFVAPATTARIEVVVGAVVHLAADL
jgi:3D (Asp-Asp-Asp) domain-containing protein